jgi:hypothetical protein
MEIVFMPIIFLKEIFNKINKIKKWKY